MARYSNRHIRKLLLESDTAPNSDVKGDKLEELVKYLFDKISGVSFYEKNVLDGVRAHELDVVFINDKRSSDLYFLDFAIITECKNTACRLGSNEVGWFVRKLQDRGVSSGILISLSGITGVSDGVSNAHSEVLSALNRDKIFILLLNREEIETLKTTQDLVELLQNKILKLTIQRTIF
ncbi:MULTISPECIES: restriction endonuclease [Chryseobacterium]|uniref:restriction endonuclease n=1 Tax=Chryseobacterium TaxID=59732 RepID=UPI001D13F85A|nr:restriction endonuclease [Chryseobacterium sp. X308]MCC3215550.1 restriction endonuclease [Chryseobacterium sp. X308]